MKKAVTFRRFDPANHILDDNDAALYLAAAAESGDPAELMTALGDVVRARKLTAVAKSAGVTRQGLNKALSGDGSPSLLTAMRVLNAVGMRFSVRPFKKARGGPQRMTQPSSTELSRRQNRDKPASRRSRQSGT